jgi:Uncharacterized protein conserved in bacteria (DUF2213)
MENQNAKDWPKIKRAKFLTQGLVSYEDSGAGIALIKNETINAGLQSFSGKPVIIDHSDVTPENYEKYRKGNVIGASYNSEDGWYYVDFIVDDDEAIKLIEEQGYSVSCAYNVLDVAAGGTYQDIPYDGEITKISFTHLALVTMPRYEESKILDEMPSMMMNGKVKARNITKQEEESMFQLFKKNKEGKQEEVQPFVVINGKEIQLQELVNSFITNNKDEKYHAKDEDLVDVNGNTISIGELKSAYMAKMKNAGPDSELSGKEDGKKKNEKDEEEKDSEGKDKKKGSSEEEIEKAAKEAKAGKKNEKDDEEKKNAKEGERFFAELNNASHKANEFIDDNGAPSGPMTRQERANRFREKTVRK